MTVSLPEKCRPVLLLTASPPGENGVGQNYLRDVCQCAPGGSFVCFAVLNVNERWNPVQAQQVGIFDTETATRQFERAFRRGTTVLAEITAAAGYYSRLVPQVHRLSSAAIHFGQVHDVSGVWAVMESPALMAMAQKVAHELSVPLHLLVWDHPDHVIRGFGHVGWTGKKLRQTFDAAVKAAHSTVSVAAALRDFLKSISPRAVHRIARAPVIDNGLTRPVAMAREAVNRSKPFVIGFAGSITAPDEVEGLQSVLDRVRWNLGGRDIVIRFFGFRFIMSATSPRRVEYRGFLDSTKDVIEALGDCDATFLPQPFHADRALVARYSFPTKLSTYVAAKRPVIVHAPPFASVPQAVSADSSMVECSVGVMSCNADSTALLPLIERLSTCSSFYSEAMSRVSEAGTDYFGVNQCRSVMSSLGVQL